MGAEQQLRRAGRVRDPDGGRSGVAAARGAGGAAAASIASLPLRRAQPLEVFVRESTAPERFRTMVLGIVALLGLVLAAVGISGVTYRGVVDRTREFAVRLALGSEPAAVVRLVLVESMRDLAIGAVVGLAGGAALCVVARALARERRRGRRDHDRRRRSS